MDINTILTIINSCGFPIAACCFMFYQNNQLTKTISDLQQTLAKIDLRIADMEEKLEDVEK